MSTQEQIEQIRQLIRLAQWIEYDNRAQEVCRAAGLPLLTSSRRVYCEQTVARIRAQFQQEAKQ